MRLVERMWVDGFMPLLLNCRYIDSKNQIVAALRPPYPWPAFPFRIFVYVFFFIHFVFKFHLSFVIWDLFFDPAGVICTLHNTIISINWKLGDNCGDLEGTFATIDTNYGERERERGYMSTVPHNRLLSD